MKKKILILGATGSIGMAVTRNLCNNYDLVCTGNKSPNKKYIKKIKNAQYFDVDLCSANSVQNLINIIKKETFYGFVNCSGSINRLNFFNESKHDFEKIYSINFTNPMMILKIVLKKMISRKTGKIIFLSSQVAKQPHDNAGPSYEISKASQIILSRLIAKKFGKYNINSNTLMIGTIESKMQKSLKKNLLKQILNNIPSKKIGHPKDVALLIDFLLSNSSSYINGALINISGGSVLD